MSIYFESRPYDHRFKEQHMLESHTFFSKMVDELVEFSEFDPELSDGIKWLDDQAQKKGITFYDMVFEVSTSPIYVKEVTDITNQVVEAYNKKK